VSVTWYFLCKFTFREHDKEVPYTRHPSKLQNPIHFCASLDEKQGLGGKACGYPEGSQIKLPCLPVPPDTVSKAKKKEKNTADNSVTVSLC
jgi:hypothetical protein